MPELPEVETIKKVLKPILVGHKITKIDILRKETIVGNSIEFKNSLENKVFLNISRIGKFLIFHLSDDLVFLSHLRMEGKYFELDEKEKNTYFSRIVFHLDNNKKVCYDDSRCFGIMILTNEKEYKSVKDIAQLGPEPFDINDVSYLLEKTKRVSKPIKSVITDQTLIAGIGNIYADEALYASKINPFTPAKLITKTEWEDIIQNSKTILKGAIESGGSTIRSYHPGKDISGNFQVNLKAYGHKDDYCPICNRKFRFTKIGGRGTTYCPGCQIKKGTPIKIAIFGKIASGKSSVNDIFNKKGYETLSCDDVVHSLYKEKEFANMISKRFSINNNPDLDMDTLRKKVLESKSVKRELENIVWPAVKERILTRLTKTKSKIIVVEVPLLFEAKMDDIFDVLIGVDISNENQIERLNKRNGATANDLYKINQVNQRFELNKEKADFIINNNFGLKELNNQVDEIIDKLVNRLN